MCVHLNAYIHIPCEHIHIKNKCVCMHSHAYMHTPCEHIHTTHSWNTNLAVWMRIGMNIITLETSSQGWYLRWGQGRRLTKRETVIHTEVRCIKHISGPSEEEVPMKGTAQKFSRKPEEPKECMDDLQ